jgi:hypothetical protein
MMIKKNLKAHHPRSTHTKSLKKWHKLKEKLTIRASET